MGRADRCGLAGIRTHRLSGVARPYWSIPGDPGHRPRTDRWCRRWSR